MEKVFWRRCGLVVCLAMAQEAFSCTTFSLNGVVGKSYDWGQSEAHVIHNKAGLAKQSLVVNPVGEKSQGWISRFSSLTFNQYGQEFPLGGMNEKGLVVEVMVLGESALPPADQRPTVNELQWIQYQLDNFESVAEAVNAEPGIRISKIYADVHYLMCDRSGECATFEYVANQPAGRAGLVSPFAVLTNDTYLKSKTYLGQFVGFGGTIPIPATAQSSLDRFAVAVGGSFLQGADPIGQALRLLEKVNVPGLTKFNIVYDQAKLAVSFRTSDHPALKTIEMAGLPSSCKQATLFTPIQLANGGNVTALMRSHTLSDNQVLVGNTLDKLGLPLALQEKAWNYPRTTVCTF